MLESQLLIGQSDDHRRGSEEKEGKSVLRSTKDVQLRDPLLAHCQGLYSAVPHRCIGPEDFLFLSFAVLPPR